MQNITTGLEPFEIAATNVALEDLSRRLNRFQHFHAQVDRTRLT